MSQKKRIFFDCMETIVDMYVLPTPLDYARWAYEGSNCSRYWSSEETFIDSFFHVKQELNKLYTRQIEYAYEEIIEGIVYRNTLIDPNNKKRVCQELLRNYWLRYAGYCYISEEKKQVLELLSNKYSLSVVSNFKLSQKIEELLQINDVDAFFDYVTVSIDCGYRKPDPQIYLEALKKANCMPEDVIFIGDDMENDYIQPTKLGMNAILYDPRQQSHSKKFRRKVTSFLELEVMISDIWYEYSL